MAIKKIYFSTPFLNSPDFRILIGVASTYSLCNAVTFQTLVPPALNDDETGDRYLSENVKKIERSDMVTILIDRSLISGLSSLGLAMAVRHECNGAMVCGKRCNVLVEESVYRDWKSERSRLGIGESILHDLLNELQGHPDRVFLASFRDRNELIERFYDGARYFFCSGRKAADEPSSASGHTDLTYSASAFELF